MLTMLKSILFTLIVISTVNSSLANNQNDSLFLKANHYYNEGLYNDAISSYQTIIRNGFESAALYYNIGNSYYKLNDMPNAILYYEKAIKLDPDNKDILNNLKIANSKIPDKIEAIPEFFLVKWWNAFYNMFSANKWTLIALILFTIMMLNIVVFFSTRKRTIKRFSFWLGLIFLVLSIFSFGLASQKYYYMNNKNEAIIFSPSVTVKSSPNKNSVDLFVIHEGTKILITEEVDGWYEIKIANGSVGWLPESTAKTI